MIRAGIIAFGCFACTCALADCVDSTPMLEQMDEKMIALVNTQGEQQMLKVKVADEPQEQAAGFQHICPEVIEDTSILFVFNRPREPVFHMRNVHASLGIAFAEADGRIGDIQRMQEEFSTGSRQLYPSATKAKYALEVRDGFFAQYGIGTGSRLVVHE